jgi:hypothetical protein
MQGCIEIAHAQHGVQKSHWDLVTVEVRSALKRRRAV